MGPQTGLHWKHLTITDRRNIEKWVRERASVAEIAQRVRVSRQTIYKELKRGMCVQLTGDYEFIEVYCADVAERNYRENLAAKGGMEKIGSDRALAEFITEKLAEGFSPYSVAQFVRQDTTHNFSCTLSTGTIYNYIPKGIFDGITKKHLPRKGAKKQKRERVTVKQAPAGESIEHRPEYINDRSEPFHWEMDSVMGGKRTKACLLCLTERYTRFEIVFRLPNHTAEAVIKALDVLEGKLGQEKFREFFKSITVDNGSEFRRSGEIERSIYGGKRTTAYYCHPYSSWERGSNENANGMLRRKFPKGCSFDNVTDEEVRAAQDWMNSYPRGIHDGWSAEQMMQAIIACGEAS